LSSVVCEKEIVVQSYWLFSTVPLETGGKFCLW